MIIKILDDHAYNHTERIFKQTVMGYFVTERYKKNFQSLILGEVKFKRNFLAACLELNFFTIVGWINE